MKSRILESEALKKAFRDAYFARERDDVGDEWKFQVMRRVRQIGPLRPGTNFWPAFEHLVWQLAPVSCLLIIVLTICFFNIGFNPGHDYLGTVTAELEEPAMAELFGLEG
jgi:hypothetical protein